MMIPRMIRLQTGSPVLPDSTRSRAGSCLFFSVIAIAIGLSWVSLPGHCEEAGPADQESETSEKDQSDGKEKDSKKAAPMTEEEQKKYFKTWFDAFYSKLYYAKDVADVIPHYTAHCRRSMAQQVGTTRLQTLNKLRGTYIGSPKIIKIINHPGGRSLDVKVEGNIAVNQRNGYGYCIYRMIKEGRIWKIDSAASRGKFTGAGMRRW